MKKIISTTDAPAAIGPYSQAVRAGSLVFCAGQVPLDPKTGQIVSEDILEQTKRVLDSVTAILKAENLTMANVVKTTVFLADFGDFQKMNEVYATYFKDNPPARSTVGVSTLPKNARVEIRPNERFIVAEDVVTRGGRVQETVDIVRAHGGQVSGIGVIVDRSGGQRPDYGCPFVSLVEMNVETFPADQLPNDLAGIPA